MTSEDEGPHAATRTIATASESGARFLVMLDPYNSAWPAATLQRAFRPRAPPRNVSTQRPDFAALAVLLRDLLLALAVELDPVLVARLPHLRLEPALRRRPGPRHDRAARLRDLFVGAGLDLMRQLLRHPGRADVEHVLRGRAAAMRGDAEHVECDVDGRAGRHLDRGLLLLAVG